MREVSVAPPHAAGRLRRETPVDRRPGRPCLDAYCDRRKRWPSQQRLDHGRFDFRRRRRRVRAALPTRSPRCWPATATWVLRCASILTAGRSSTSGAAPRTRAASAPWTQETVNVLFSCTKGLMSILAAQLVEDGPARLRRPVSALLARIRTAGKAETRVRHLLSHRAGLSAPRVRLTTEDILDWQKHDPPPGGAGAAVAARPGPRLPRADPRLAGRRGDPARDRKIGGPSTSPMPSPARSTPMRGSGFPSRERRGSPISPSATAWRARSRPMAKRTGARWRRRLGGALPGALAGPDDGFNDPRLWQAEIPGAGGIADARSLARIWSATVCETAGRQTAGRANGRACDAAAERGRAGLPGAAAVVALGHGLSARFAGAPLPDGARVRPRRRRRTGRLSRSRS